MVLVISIGFDNLLDISGFTEFMLSVVFNFGCLG